MSEPDLGDAGPGANATTEKPAPADLLPPSSAGPGDVADVLGGVETAGPAAPFTAASTVDEALEMYRSKRRRVSGVTADELIASMHAEQRRVEDWWSQR